MANNDVNSGIELSHVNTVVRGLAARLARSPAAGGAPVMMPAPDGASRTGLAPQIARVVYAYVRVSSDDQETAGYSPEVQCQQIRAWCERNGYPEPVIFQEAKSGKSDKARAKFRDMISQVGPGAIVVVTKIDRFARNTVDMLTYVDRITSAGASFVSIEEGAFSCTPEERFKLTLWAAFAEYERSRIANRTSSSRKYLREQGIHCEGKPPFGYRLPDSKAKGADRSLVIVEEDAVVIRTMFTLCIAGHGIPHISRHIRATYPEAAKRRAFGLSWCNHVLRNRVYTGQVSLTPVKPHTHRRANANPGKWVDAHAPIVSREVYERAQEALTGRRCAGANPSEHSRTYHWMLVHVARCAQCNSVIYAENPIHVKHGGYYVCRKRWHEDKAQRCPTNYFHRDKIDPVVEAAVLARVCELRKVLAAPPPTNPDAPDFDARRREIKHGIDSLLSEIVSAKSAIVRDAFADRIARLESDLAMVDAQETDHKRMIGNDNTASRAASLAVVETIEHSWEKMPGADRREVLSLCAKRILVQLDGTVSIEWRDARDIAAVVGETSKAPAPELPELPEQPAQRARDTEPASERRAKGRAARPAGKVSAARAAVQKMRATRAA